MSSTKHGWQRWLEEWLRRTGNSIRLDTLGTGQYQARLEHDSRYYYGIGASMAWAVRTAKKSLPEELQ